MGHYAATVSYNLTGWLFKNKDPLNDTIVEMMKNGTNPLLVRLFADHPGQPTETKKEEGGKKKKGGGKTVSSFYKTQLDDLMKTLYATDPSFIRCVVPNTHKIPGGVEPGLIMHQYQCNGVLTGIAICRKGFPNKTIYPEFKQRYNILAANEVAKAKKDKDAAKAVLEKIALEPEKYRLGHTKVFFRAGILGYMEEVREDRIGQVLSYLQAQARGKSSRIVFKKLQEQKLALYACQRSLRNYQIGKNWLWWKLWLALKPNLKCKKVTAQHEKLMNEKNELMQTLESGGSAVQDLVDKTNKIEGQKNDLQKQVDDLNNRIRAEEDGKAHMSAQATKLRTEMDKIKNETKELDNALLQCEDDKETKNTQINTLKEELQQQEDLLNKLQKEKRSIGDSRQRTEEEIQALELEFLLLFFGGNLRCFFFLSEACLINLLAVGALP